MPDAQHMAFECPSEDISAYIDGEMDLVREMEMDAHFAACSICSLELNQQKQFLCGLNSSLKEEKEFELPANFAKQIVANAESTVSGLRRPRERYNAVFICVGLFLFVLFAMGAEAGKLLRSFYGFFEQTAVVAGFVGHLIYSVFIGVVIVLRSFASQVRFEVVLGFAVAVCFAAAFMFISRRVLRTRRA